MVVVHGELVRVAQDNRFPVPTVSVCNSLVAEHAPR
jgi:hypothetical protein